MNERIKSLLAQAHLDADNIKDTNWIANRFAELIIQECRDMFVVNSPSWNLLNEKLEHFGVEK